MATHLVANVSGLLTTVIQTQTIQKKNQEKTGTQP